MASDLKRTRSTTDKVSVKGTLSEDGTIITYLNEDKNECEISVDDCLRVFRGKNLSFTVQVKKDEELDVEFTEADTEQSGQTEVIYIWLARAGQ